METKWIEEYKMLANMYKNEESYLLRSFLNSNFHLKKQFDSLKDIQLSDSRKVQETTSFISGKIKDYIANSQYQFRPNDQLLSTKLQNINSLITKSKHEFKQIYEKLTQEEIDLTVDLNEIENRIANSSFISNNTTDNHNHHTQNNNKNNDTSNADINIIDGELNNISNSSNHKSLLSKNKKEELTIDTVISNIMNNFIISKNNFPEELLENFIDNINNESFIREKIQEVDDILIVNLKAPNYNWSANDHNEFIKIVSMYSGNINGLDFFESLEIAIPYLPVSELRNHIKIYNKSVLLKEIKKILLNRHKNIKAEKINLKNKEIIDNTINIDFKLNKIKEIATNNELDYEDLIINIDRNKIARIKEINEEEILNLLKQELNNKNDKEKKKQELEEWKRYKEIRKNEDILLKKQLDHEAKIKERDKYLKKKQDNQKIIEAYKEKKNYKENTQEFPNNGNHDHTYYTKNEFPYKKQISNIDLQRIQEKNNYLIEKKIQMKRVKSSNGLKSEIQFNKFKEKRKSELINTTSKLTELTTNYQMKQRTKFDPNNQKSKDCSTLANNVLGRTALKVPEWRKNL